MKALVNWNHLVNMKMLKLPGIIIIAAALKSLLEGRFERWNRKKKIEITTHGSHLFPFESISGNSGKVKQNTEVGTLSTFLTFEFCQTSSGTVKFKNKLARKMVEVTDMEAVMTSKDID